MADFIDPLEDSGGVTLVAGTDTPLFMLDQEGRFRLAADRLQWIIQRCEGMRQGGPRTGQTRYTGERFCTTRDVLLRDLHELGCKLAPEARARIEVFPDTVKEWLETCTAEPSEARYVAIRDVGEEYNPRPAQRERAA